MSILSAEDRTKQVFYADANPQEIADYFARLGYQVDAKPDSSGSTARFSGIHAVHPSTAEIDPARFHLAGRGAEITGTKVCLRNDGKDVHQDVSNQLLHARGNIFFLCPHDVHVVEGPILEDRALTA
jgi:hypothetical protein